MDILLFIIRELWYLIITYGAMVVYMMNVPRLLHYMQLEGYKNGEFMKWVTRNPKVAFKGSFKQFFVTGAFAVFLTGLNYVFLSKLSLLSDTELAVVLLFELIALIAVFGIPNIVKAFRDKKIRKAAKKPLVYTGRAKRLMFWNFATLALLEVTFLYDLDVGTNYMFNVFKTVFYSFLILVMPVNMIIANLLAYPTEKIFGDWYVFSARRKLKKKAYKNLIKIGVTGSFGKTSTKFILQTILSEKYNVLASPESYNTTMGNVRVIREMLKPEHEVLIAEMGARYRYDIQEICEFVKPQIGIITSIGPQHLESFKNIDNVVKTKSELLAALPENGVVFLPNDDSHCLKLYNKEKRTKYIYGVNDKHADVYAKDIKLSSEGCSFIAVTKNGEFKCVSKLLGKHNVQNILGCIAIAVHLGPTNEEIANGVSKITPVKHRLELLPTSNGITVIDDAFNSNPVGSEIALEVLKQFDGRKIIITPGMVELRKR